MKAHVSESRQRGETQTNGQLALFGGGVEPIVGLLREGAARRRGNVHFACKWSLACIPDCQQAYFSAMSNSIARPPSLALRPMRWMRLPSRTLRWSHFLIQGMDCSGVKMELDLGVGGSDVGRGIAFFIAHIFQ